MGLFNRLLKDIKNEVVNNVVDKVVGEFLPTNKGTSNSTTPASISNTQVTHNTVMYPNNHNTGDEYFASLITQSNFPEYTIEKDIHPDAFDSCAHPKCFHISYLFKKDGVPKLAVFIMNSNQYKSMTARGSYQILEDNNIKYIRFFKGMENEKSYVLNRIKENLN